MCNCDCGDAQDGCCRAPKLKGPEVLPRDELIAAAEAALPKVQGYMPWKRLNAALEPFRTGG